jgi:hypothetical protein
MMIDISEMSENEIRDAITKEQPMTPKSGDYVESAMLHVRKFHPTCTRVLFDSTGRWRYMDSNNNGFSFEDDQIDINLLEIASDTLNQLPVLFELR